VDNRQIRFQEGLGAEPPSNGHLEQLQRLLTTSAFWAQDRTLEDWAVAIANSNPVISAWDEDLLIGFARATSDGIFRATIWDVVIDDNYRGRGLGRKLVQTVLAHPHLQKVERVYLMTTHQQSFYERIGFQANSSTTMVLCQAQPDPVAALARELPLPPPIHE
jgi:N-acetylglutamate synthase-like GNAT family acetyltransferase